MTINSIFKNKKFNVSKLVPFGFEQSGTNYIYRRIFPDSGFIQTVTVTENGDVFSDVTDPTFGEPYTLYLDENAEGAFVTGIRNSYEETLREIAEKCFEPDIFKSEQAKELIAYVRDTYGDELEFLWEKFSDNAIFRRKDSQKWYGLMLPVSKRKLGIKSDETVEIIVFRMSSEQSEALKDNIKYFPGYHMNKKNWCTVILDNSVPLREIYDRIDESYSLAAK